MSSAGRVTLNISGHRFEVPRNNFARYPESLLGSLATPGASSELQCDENGEYFFDRYVSQIVNFPAGPGGPKTQNRK